MFYVDFWKGELRLQKRKRQSNLELLRIISMFFIVLHHFAYHGSMTWACKYSKDLIQSERVYVLLCCLGKAAVVSFVLIGAYFLSKKRFKLLRIVNLGETTFIYSWLIYLVLLFSYPSIVKPISAMSVCLPIPLPSNYWFVIAYLYMLLFMPFMNLLLDKLNRRQLLVILVCLFVLWNILQFVPSNKPDNDQWNFFSNNNYFLFLYLIAGYIRKYQPIIVDTLFKSFIAFLVSIIIIAIVIFEISRSNYLFISSFMATLNNPFSLMLGVFIFCLFRKINLGVVKTINFISQSMFGVYLIHDNPFVRDLLWHKIINNTYYNSNGATYLIYGIIVSLSIFFICILIDSIKRYVVDRSVNKILAKYTCYFLMWSRNGK